MRWGPSWAWVRGKYLRSWPSKMVVGSGRGSGSLVVAMGGVRWLLWVLRS